MSQDYSLGHFRLVVVKIQPKSLFKFFAVAEMFTWALLITALILRATVGIAPELFSIAGGSHGFTFLGYGVVAALVGVNQRWNFFKIVLGISLAVVPFATYPFERYLSKKKSLEGPWRTDQTDHPGDKAIIDRLFRWFIKRPLVLVSFLFVSVVTVFSTLLWLGPPGQWFD